MFSWEVVTFNYLVFQNPISLILDEKSMQRYRQIHSMLWRYAILLECDEIFMFIVFLEHSGSHIP
jgi:hypothetical protein